MHFPTGRTSHTTAFDGQVVDHSLEQERAHTANASAVQDRSGDSNLYRWVLYRLSYVLLQNQCVCMVTELFRKAGPVGRTEGERAVMGDRPLGQIGWQAQWIAPKAKV